MSALLRRKRLAPPVKEDDDLTVEAPTRILPKVLMVVEQEGWAFARIAEQLVKRLSDEFDFTVRTYESVMQSKSEYKAASFDLVIPFWWGYADRLKDLGPCLTMFYDHFTWKAAPSKLAQALEASAFLGFGNVKIRTEMHRFVDVSLQSFVLEDGVDTDKFCRKVLIPRTFTAGWAGNSALYGHSDPKHDRKGILIVQEACRLAGIPLKTCDKAKGTDIPHDLMPDFYNSISVYLNASESEGTPNPILEASACERPVITTKVGIVDKCVSHGKSGLIVPRNVEAFRNALIEMRDRWDLRSAGRVARDLSLRHTWGVKATRWTNVLRKATINSCK